MPEFFQNDLLWWVTAIDIPVATAFIVSFTRLKREVSDRLGVIERELNSHKLDVVQNYASISHVKDLESRIIAHLLRIETKLDHTALKAHALYVNPNLKQENHHAL